MELTGTTRIEASREVVWSGLNDPDVLRQAIPGCEHLEQNGDGGFSAKVVLKVGPVKARFAGAVTLSEVDPPNGYVISGKGESGLAGFAKGQAVVRLEEEDPGVTILTYDARADVGGKIAQLGARMLDSTAKKLAKQFFDNFARVVTEVPASAQ